MIKTKLRTWSSLLFLIFISSTLQANTRDGLYFGAGVGASFDQFNLTTSNNNTGFTVYNTANQTNALGDLFLGLGYTTNNALFLGGEIGTNFPNHSVQITGRPGVSLTALTFNDKITIQDYITADLLPGYAFTPNLLFYGRAGFSYGELSLNQPSHGTAPFFHTNSNTWGGRFGIGSNFAVTSNIGIALDYYYAMYQNMNTTWPLFNEHFASNPNSNFLGVSFLYKVV